MVSADAAGSPRTEGGRSTSPEMLWTVAAVARRLGVAPATLRTWARRYGLGPSEHVSGTHRRYNAGDLQRLQGMRRLTMAGMAAADAAKAILGLGSAETVDSTTDRPGRPGGPGGRVIALPGGHPGQRGLAAAAMALDAAAVTELVSATLQELGAVGCWEELLRPVLVAIGKRWESTEEGVEVEHLMSYAMETALRQYSAATPEPSHGRPLLLAGAPGEWHYLPLAALGAALSDVGIGVRHLGPSTPADALAAAVRRTGPCAVVLWAHQRMTADPRVIGGIPVTRPAPEMVAAGPGWTEVELPERVRWVASLAAAVRLTSAVARP
jgi:DNA-binding transcriptional MerR regulator